MCCEECSNYQICLEDNVLKDDCCPKCPEYYECKEADTEEDSFGDFYGDNDYEGHF